MINIITTSIPDMCWVAETIFESTTFVEMVKKGSDGSCGSKPVPTVADQNMRASDKALTETLISP